MEDKTGGFYLTASVARISLIHYDVMRRPGIYTYINKPLVEGGIGTTQPFELDLKKNIDTERIKFVEQPSGGPWS